MQIPQNIIDEVISRADLVAVIGRHIKLKKAGQNYFACCPFHNEKSPSFSVSPVKQIYHCFGCSESGNAISFLMKYSGLDFVSAVKLLASEYGVHIPEDESQPKLTKQQQQERKEHKLNLQETIDKVLKFYRQQLTTSSVAKHYLHQRGLSLEIIHQFELGFAAGDYQNLQREFKDYANNKFLVDCGVVIDGENNRRYDRFRERVIFPIRNLKGDLIGFGGRIIAKGEPKYLNSPETELFNKSHELYGLFHAKKSIRELNQVIVVEGYMDVIALNQFGITNVVATMGTAATEEHIRALFRLCDNICYSFDGDTAGRRAAWRALERSCGIVTDIKAVNFLFLPTEHDPDSFIRAHGVDEFRIRVKSSPLGLVTFLLNQLTCEVQINSDEGKARLISLVKPYLEQIKAIALQVILKKQLAVIVDLDPSVVESILNNRGRFAFYNRKIKQISGNYQDNIKRSPLTINPLKGLVSALLFNPKLAREFPVPEYEQLILLQRDTQQLFSLISYLELNCDEFADIDIQVLDQVISFSELNLAAIYNQVKEERHQFQNVFNIPAEDYRKKLQELVKNKKRKRMPITAN